MQQTLHTDYTANEIIVPPMFFGSSRPKVWLQHCESEAERLAVQTFILNRGKSGEAFALENLRRTLKGG